MTYPPSSWYSPGPGRSENPAGPTDDNSSEAGSRSRSPIVNAGARTSPDVCSSERAAWYDPGPGTSADAFSRGSEETRVPNVNEGPGRAEPENPPNTNAAPGSSPAYSPGPRSPDAAPPFEPSALVRAAIVNDGAVAAGRAVLSVT